MANDFIVAIFHANFSPVDNYMYVEAQWPHG